jgi:hypothetical protein
MQFQNTRSDGFNAETEPNPLIFNRGFHGFDLDKTNTKEIEESGPNSRLATVERNER